MEPEAFTRDELMAYRDAESEKSKALWADQLGGLEPPTF